MNVVMICSNGISSSLVISRMKQYADAKGIALNVHADNEDNLPYIYKDYDVILVAPHMSHHYDAIVSRFLGTGKIIGMVPMQDYGLANGEHLVKYVQQLYEEKTGADGYDFEDEMLQMIAYAGKAKQYAYEAMNLLERRQYAKAMQQVKTGKKELAKAHRIQTAVIASQLDEENRINVRVTLLMVHAQDHVSGSETALDFAEHLIRIFERKKEDI